jgi:hypothetical protein
MKKRYFIRRFIVTNFIVVTAFSCNAPTTTTDENASGKADSTAAAAAAAPSFTIGVKAKTGLPVLPYLQSFVWAREGNKILLIGGRTEGFHGRTVPDSAFKSRKANTSVFLVDFDAMKSWEMPLKMSDPDQLQFASTNMEFCQSGDRLSIAGGFGIKNPSDTRGNFTFDRFVSISISSLIKQVQMGTSGSISKAIAGRATSPFLQVAGGEMVYQNNSFYLMFGQNYHTLYVDGVNGDYTCAVRKFNFTGNNITDTVSYIDTAMLHRRDLPAATITQNENTFYAAFGGVFNQNDDGFQNPVYINLNGGQISVTQDTMVQITNQYDCALVSVFDAASNSSITALLGGIGKFQYHPATHSWEDGDGGAKLPFVKTITQMIYYNGIMRQQIQLPPENPELPDLAGANAIFIPGQDYIYSDQTIDYSKITADTTLIGLMYGGIKAMGPTSSPFYPTSVNNTIYEVYLYKSTAK